jgi:DNA modification methylase
VSFRILQGDVIKRLRDLHGRSVDCVVTSPPYWGLRDYGVPGQLGLEPTPAEYIAKMVDVFREVRRVLRKDGTCWVNMGDSYVSTGGVRAHGWQPETNGRGEPNTYPKRDGETIMPMARNRQRKDADPKRRHSAQTSIYRGACASGSLKAKDLCGIPWRLAFALQNDGWWLRQDIIWHKPNPIPESITDRCTKAHEYIFLLSKSATYYFDADAIKEPASLNTHDRGSNPVNPKAKWKTPDGWDTSKGEGGHGAFHRKGREAGKVKQNESFSAALVGKPDNRNKRSVWTVGTQAFPEAHFATFPEKLIEPCILAGCPAGGTVLDPFSGSGTTGVVALRYHRNYIGIELSAEYAAMSERRITSDSPLFNQGEITA